jgi:hypothetical protein
MRAKSGRAVVGLRRRGKASALTAVTVGLGVLIGAGIAAKNRILEEWYLYRLSSGSWVERVEAADRLAVMASANALLRAIRAVARTDRAVTIPADWSIGKKWSGPGIPRKPEPVYSTYFSMLLRTTCRGREASIPPLVRGLGDNEWKVRFLSAWLLGMRRWQDEITVLTGLREAQTDADERVRFSVQVALAKLTGIATEETGEFVPYRSVFPAAAVGAAGVGDEGMEGKSEHAAGAE